MYSDSNQSGDIDACNVSLDNSLRRLPNALRDTQVSQGRPRQNTHRMQKTLSCSPKLQAKTALVKLSSVRRLKFQPKLGVAAGDTGSCRKATATMAVLIELPASHPDVPVMVI